MLDTSVQCACTHPDWRSGNHLGFYFDGAANFDSRRRNRGELSMHRGCEAYLGAVGGIGGLLHHQTNQRVGRIRRAASAATGQLAIQKLDLSVPTGTRIARGIG
jgi:hypothetical protein